MQLSIFLRIQTRRNHWFSFLSGDLLHSPCYFNICSTDIRKVLQTPGLKQLGVVVGLAFGVLRVPIFDALIARQLYRTFQPLGIEVDVCEPSRFDPRI